MNEMISIIVPVYNAESTLERCVSALVGQTYQNIEIILVNDGSTDRSLEICRRWAAEDARVQVIDKPNGGVSSARNAGLDQARGEFIMFCDSDDWAEPDWCQELISHYEAGCLVMCGHYVEGEQNYLPREIRADHHEVYQFNEITKLRSSFFTCPWNKLYLTDVLRNHHLRFIERLSNGEDYLFNLQYITRLDGHIIRLDKCVFHYSWPTGNSLSSRISDDFFDQLQILFHSIMREINALQIQEEHGMATIYQDFFYQFEKGILAELSALKPLSKRISRINRIMRTQAYQECVQNTASLSGVLWRTIWKRKNCIGLLLWNTISRLRRKDQRDGNI